jgi:hypothetical protein
MVGWKKPALFFFLILFFAARAFAQDAGETGKESPPWPIMLFYQDESRLSPAEARLFYEALASALRGAGEGFTVVEARPLEGPGSDDERSSLARRNACEGWMWVRLRDSGGALEAEYALYDALAMDFIIRDSFTKPKPNIRDMVYLFWQGPASALSLLPPREPDPPFTIHGLPGSWLYGLWGKKSHQKLGKDGLLRYWVPLPGTYTLRAQKLGYDPVTEHYLFKEPGGDIYLPEQRKGRRFSLGFSLFDVQYPEIDFGYGIIPYRLYAQGGLVFFYPNVMFGPMNPDHKEDLKSTQGGNYLINLDLQVKWYFRQPDKVFRPYLGAGILTRIWLNKFIDPLVPFGLFPVLGIDSRLTPGARFFVELQPTFYRITGDEERLRYSTYNYWGPAIEYTIMNDYIGALDGMHLGKEGQWFLAPHFKIGLRWYFDPRHGDFGRR